ncbi:MAG: glycosyltransferase [Thermoplasmata archaeon]|nr:glycosyltransferase [Thermoplasmata archaeon]
MKFAKYLPDFEWEPHILTRHLPKGIRERDVRPRELPASVRVHRAFALENYIPARLMPPAHLFLRPDPTILWALNAKRTAKKVIEKYNISAIYTTSGPPATNILGRWLKRSTDLPWVADFRDPWTRYAFAKYPSKFHKDIDRHLEASVARDADVIIHNTQTLKDEFVRMYGKAAARRSVVIPNGYDPQDFMELKGPEDRSAKERKMRISYVGRVYPSVDNFFKGLGLFLKENPDARTHLGAVFVGNENHQDIARLAEKRGVGDIVEAKPPVPHEEAIELMVHSDVLLLLIPHKNNLIKGVPSQKIYEYMASETHILGLVPREGMAEKMINSTMTGTTADPNSPKAISDSIKHVFELYQQRGLRTRKPDLSMYDRRYLTKRLASIFYRLVK